MKKIFTIVLVISMSVGSKCQSTLMFVKQFQVNASKHISLDENYDTRVSSSDNSLITISAEVEANVNERILNQLFKVGRYSIVIKDGKILLDGIKKIVFINGVQLEENVTLNIEIPSGVILINNINAKLL